MSHSSFLFSSSDNAIIGQIQTIEPPDAAQFVDEIKLEILPEITLFLTSAAGIILLFAALKSLAGKL